MFNKDYKNNMFKGKPKLNNTLKESPYTCEECSNSLFLKGDTYLTCNCNDCPCFGEEIPVNSVGPPPNCSSSIRYELLINGVPQGAIGLGDLNSNGQIANGFITIAALSDATLNIELFDPLAVSGGITVTGASAVGTGVLSPPTVVTLPYFVSVSVSSVTLISIPLKTDPGPKAVQVVIETDCGDITIGFIITVI